MTQSPNPERQARVIAPHDGRSYEMGPMRAVFLADGDETERRYSVSEWWLEPHTGGPHEHDHEDDHVYYVICGVVSVSLDGVWSEAGRGSYILIPGGTPHSFENRSAARAGFISFTAPGGFEDRMADIAEAMRATDLRI